MTYHERDLPVSRSLQKRTFNNSNNRWYSSHLSPSQTLRIECKAEERHYLDNIFPHKIDSSLKPIRYKMNDPIKPIKFRSEIIVHDNPDVDLHIQRLRVDFRYHDDTPVNAIVNHHSSSRSQSVHIPKSSISHEQKDKRRFRPAILSQPQVLLHQWIDDICANEQLMSNDDIVFFIKNGEFFARI